MPNGKYGWLRGWMLPVSVIVLGLAELAILVTIASKWGLWAALGVVAIGTIVGCALLLSAGQQAISRLVSVYRSVTGRGAMKERMSRPAFTVLAAFLFFFPGVLTDIAGLVLLLTPVQDAAVKKAGFTPGSRRVLYSRRSGSVIDGEIVIDARDTRRSDAPSQADPSRAIEGSVIDADDPPAGKPNTDR